ncbi:hypothetical protein [Metabacillus iocasae]|uniref:Uncharacterized protein n=1 Tax=Priestia iocasae TaxID=2291674 RepID=A0ABS2QZ94_9BACI|nr:hypothetical protein [Metabacillus iocasae]MBM7704801.1 hypothetical protein [Metabacillus iocasae]
MAKKNKQPEINEEIKPYFEAPDNKILAVDMFRGPYTGIYSDFDLSNPGQKRFVDEYKKFTD